MAIVNIYLRYDKDDLHYSYSNNNFKPLHESTATGVNEGDTVNFIVNDDSILEITKIKVNQQKSGGKPYKALWAKEPAPYKGSNKQYQGVIASKISVTEQVFNGYTIYYTTASGSKEKDPDMKYPPTP